MATNDILQKSSEAILKELADAEKKYPDIYEFLEFNAEQIKIVKSILSDLETGESLDSASKNKLISLFNRIEEEKELENLTDFANSLGRPSEQYSDDMSSYEESIELTDPESENDIKIENVTELDEDPLITKQQELEAEKALYRFLEKLNSYKQEFDDADRFSIAQSLIDQLNSHAAALADQKIIASNQLEACINDLNDALQIEDPTDDSLLDLTQNNVIDLYPQQTAFNEAFNLLMEIMDNDPNLLQEKTEQLDNRLEEIKIQQITDEMTRTLDDLDDFLKNPHEHKNTDDSPRQTVDTQPTAVDSIMAQEVDQLFENAEKDQEQQQRSNDIQKHFEQRIQIRAQKEAESRKQAREKPAAKVKQTLREIKAKGQELRDKLHDSVDKLIHKRKESSSPQEPTKDISNKGPKNRG